ncbi:MAG: hypothetical protein N4A32_08585 [Marinifilaceae bacterium]|jgi:hypothetical protein|nr:hypothetical protein [Marinifilaceae bacterium]
MKHLKILIFILLISSPVLSQDNNNRFGLIDLSKKPKEAKKVYGAIKNFHISSRILENNKVRSKSGILRSYTNANKLYMPSPIDQIGSSCAFASCIGYIYSYDLNSLYNRESNKDNELSYFYSWNYWNNGDPRKGGFPWYAWSTMEDNGWMLQKDFHYSKGTHWADGYEKYSKGFKDGAEQYKIAFDPEDTFISRLKSYLINKGGTNDKGGLIQFSAFAHPLNPNIFNEDPKFKNKGTLNCNAIIPKFGVSGMHSMTIVGYDDDVWYDYNGNNIKDQDEVGAFHCINTWGTDWGDKGYFYAPYKTFTDFMQGNGGTGNGGKDCFVVTAYHRQTQYALKLKMLHSVRNQIYIEYSDGKEIFKKEIMNKQGGYRCLHGEYFMGDKPLTAGLNLIKLPKDTAPSDIRITVHNEGREMGSILEAELIQYSGTETMSYDIFFPNKYLNPFGKGQGKIADPYPSIQEKVKFRYNEKEKIISLFFNNTKASFYQIDILSLDGKLIYESLMKDLQAGRNFDKVSLKILKSGEKILRILTGGKIIYKRINIK